jgi:hypothetical protein
MGSMAASLNAGNETTENKWEQYILLKSKAGRKQTESSAISRRKTRFRG